jgi:Acetyltransferase (GNAT) domain
VLSAGASSTLQAIATIDRDNAPGKVASGTPACSAGKEKSRSASVRKPTAKAPPSEPTSLLFHEPWWLAAATGGDFHQAIATRGGQVVGRLPYVIVRQKGFSVCQMPPFTHVLGPVVQAGTGKPQTVLLQRLSIIRELIDQLPPVSSFKQALGLSLADGLAFQDRGFQVTPQYTFQIDCRESLDNLWSEVHSKTRQHIRRAGEKYTIVTIDDVQTFISFYLDNVQRAGLRSFIDFTNFPALFTAARDRQCAEILCATGTTGKPVAMVFVVWGQGRMYYLMSTRARDKDDNGSVNLLIWEGMQRAHKHGLVFDLDGVSTSGTARFLSGFGGGIAQRLIVQRTSMTYGALREVKRFLGRGKADATFPFT